MSAIIGIDGSSILPRRTGVGRYTFNLLRGLSDLEGDHRFVVFLNSLRHPFPPDAAFLRRAPCRARRYRIPGPWLVKAWKRWEAPAIEWFAGRCDVFHSPATYVPPQRHGARVTTLHDLYFLKHPEDCHDLGGRYLAERLPRVAPALDCVIAVSRATAADAIERLGLAPERVHVVHSGVEERFAPVTNPETGAAARERYGIPSEFLLTVATLEPRKNLRRLLEAYRLLRGMGGEPPPLVLVGARGWNQDNLHRTIAELGLGRRLILTGFVDDADLPALYSQARVFALPSLYEGFGFPVLEAMACGTPVVASTTPALAEIAEGAALLADPLDVESIAQALREALESETARARLIASGRERARQFTWRRCAEQTLAVYLRAHSLLSK